MIRQAIILTVILFVGLGAVATTKAQGQQMYSWTDENGVVHFSDTRPEGQQVSEQMIPNDPQPAADNPYQQVENQPSIAQQRRDEIAQKSQQAQVNQAVYSAQCSSWQAEVDRSAPHGRLKWIAWSPTGACFSPTRRVKPNAWMMLNVLIGLHS
jgi:hypothetical protein